MCGNSVLADTNIILYLLSGETNVSDLLHGKQTYLSFITELELLSFRNLSGHEYQNVKDFISDCYIFDINQQIKKIVIELRQNYSLKLPDAIVAATASYLDIPLITSDKDFRKIKEINIVFLAH